MGYCVLMAYVLKQTQQQKARLSDKKQFFMEAFELLALHRFFPMVGFVDPKNLQIVDNHSHIRCFFNWFLAQLILRSIFQLGVAKLVLMLQKQPADHPPHGLAGLPALRAGLVDLAANLVKRFPVDPLVYLTESPRRARTLT